MGVVTDTRNPFIAGSWVRADNFYGRGPLIRQILDGERDSLWVVGARRLGKTSLLKELEFRVLGNPQTSYAPLYWDLQGSGDARGLADSLLESVEDSDAFRRSTDVQLEQLEGLAVPEMLTTLARRTVKSGWRLLLLVDEAEELLNVASATPVILARLRRLLQKGPDIRSVLTSTKRLAMIDETAGFATSPFLQGFIPPVYLTPLSPDEARELLSRGRFSGDEAATIIERTGCHPFLVQLIASRLFESRDLAATLSHVAADEMVANFFSVDFQTLGAEEREMLSAIARDGEATLAALTSRLGGPERIDSLLYGLERMGYIVTANGKCRVGNWFFDRWLRSSSSAGSGANRS